MRATYDEIMEILEEEINLAKEERDKLYPYKEWEEFKALNPSPDKEQLSEWEKRFNEFKIAQAKVYALVDVRAKIARKPYEENFKKK